MKITRALTALGLLAALFFTAACVTNPLYDDIEVDTEADPGLRIENYRTYAWAAAAAVVNDPDGAWNEPEFDVGAEIVFLANRQLRERGLIEAVESPDALLLYAVGIDMKSLDVVIEPGGAGEQLAEVPKGALAILMIDPASRRVMWVGSAVANLAQDPTVEETRKRLEYAIHRMFLRFGE